MDKDLSPDEYGFFLYKKTEGFHYMSGWLDAMRMSVTPAFRFAELWARMCLQHRMDKCAPIVKIMDARDNFRAGRPITLDQASFQEAYDMNGTPQGFGALANVVALRNGHVRAVTLKEIDDVLKPVSEWFTGRPAIEDESAGRDA